MSFLAYLQLRKVIGYEQKWLNREKMAETGLNEMFNKLTVISSLTVLDKGINFKFECQPELM